jgi:hypothetical protein
VNERAGCAQLGMPGSRAGLNPIESAIARRFGNAIYGEGARGDAAIPPQLSALQTIAISAR